MSVLTGHIPLSPEAEPWRAGWADPSRLRGYAALLALVGIALLVVVSLASARHYEPARSEATSRPAAGATSAGC